MHGGREYSICRGYISDALDQNPLGSQKSVYREQDVGRGNPSTVAGKKPKIMLPDHRFCDNGILSILLAQVREENAEGVWTGEPTIREEGWGKGSVVDEGWCVS